MESSTGIHLKTILRHSCLPGNRSNSNTLHWKIRFHGILIRFYGIFLLFAVQHARSARRNSWFSSLSQRRSREGKSFVDRIEFLWFLVCFENAMISWRYDLVSVIFSPFWNRNDLLKTRSDAISVICYRFWDRDDWSLEVAIFGIWTEILMFSSILWWIFWNWVEVY